MDESRMAEFLATVPIPGRGTFFCTQPYACLDATAHELAPHPYLGDKNDWQQELQAKRAEFPKAKGWRSHSCIFSHLLAQDVARLGYVYASTHDDVGRAGIQPHRHCWGVWQMPIYYMDNLDFSRKNFWGAESGRIFDPVLIERAVCDEGIYVFDFHPVHLLINTPSPEFYFEKREFFKSGAPVSELAHSAYGARKFYNDLLAAMSRNELQSQTMEHALNVFIRDQERLG
jgi:hypothetical protein